MTASPRFENALVTGASGTLGAAIARALSAGGLGVALAARRVESCAELAVELEAAGGRALAVALDVTDEDSIARALAAALALGPLDVLVNNAGIAESGPLVSKDGPAASDAFHARHFAVNYDGPRRLAESLLPAMLERGRGAIVNVASSAGLVGYAYVAAYCASKHALLGWTRAAAAELAKSGVAVHAVCPHYVDSAMTDRSVENIVAKTGRAADSVRAWLASQNPGGRLVAPEEVAAAVGELARPGQPSRILELDGAGAHDVGTLS